MNEEMKKQLEEALKRAEQCMPEIHEKYKKMLETDVAEPDGPLAGPTDELSVKRFLRELEQELEDEDDDRKKRN